MLVMPSLDEGFGLPVLEAMACGVPVVIANRGSLPEVAGDAAAAVEPDDVGALCARMKALLDDGQANEARQRGVKRAEAFDWSASARAALGAYQAALQRRHAHRG
jgi:alpha-1,3-rhamnosyl/mannosyltransferase